MKYDLNKLVDETTIDLQWHGEPTKVLVRGDSKKTEVNTGDVVSFAIDQAKELLRYSYLWTKKGDKPVKHAYNEVAVPAAVSINQVEVDNESNEKTSTSLDVDLSSINYDDKKQVVAGLKFLQVTFNDRQGVKKLADLLKEKIAEMNKPLPAEGDVTDEGVAHYVTAEDLEENNDLTDQGVKIGDLIYLPAQE